jgi:hypothetical protein
MIVSIPYLAKKFFIASLDECGLEKKLETLLSEIELRFQDVEKG